MAGSRIVAGRQRVTRVTSPTEAGYVRGIQQQFKAIRKNLDAAIASIEKATVPAVRFAVKPIFEESQRLVPKDTLKLMQSGYLVVRRIKKKEVQVEIGYGKGSQPPYSVYVHEVLSYKHDTPTQAKFLEAAINKGIRDIAPRARDYIRQRSALGRGASNA